MEEERTNSQGLLLGACKGPTLSKLSTPTTMFAVCHACLSRPLVPSVTRARLHLCCEPQLVLGYFDSPRAQDIRRFVNLLSSRCNGPARASEQCHKKKGPVQGTPVEV